MCPHLPAWDLSHSKSILLPQGASDPREMQGKKGEEGDNKITPPLPSQVLWEVLDENSSCSQGKVKLSSNLPVPHGVWKSTEHIRDLCEPFQGQNNPCWTNTLLERLWEDHPKVPLCHLQHCPVTSPLKIKLLAQTWIPISCYHCRSKQICALISSQPSFQHPKLLKKKPIPILSFIPMERKKK